MNVKCIKEYKNAKVKVGNVYQIIDADIHEYLIKVEETEIWIFKDDIEHFKYSV